MKKHHHSLRTMALVALVCLAIFPVSVLAEEKEVVSASIPVSVTVAGKEGTLERDIPQETYRFELTALDAAPMPEETVLTIDGAGSGSFLIDYSTVGVYRYRVAQDASHLSGEKTACHGRGNYDSDIYYVTVTVTNTEDGGIGASVAAHRNSADGEKTDVRFDNLYDPVPYEFRTVVKKWTDNTSARPVFIHVQLLDDGQVVDTVELNQEMDWTYTWDELDPYGEHKWEIKEIPVNGFDTEYSTSADGNTVTIHNIGYKVSPVEPGKPGNKLIQTGQLNWPVPVMIAVGVFLLVGGIFNLTRKKGEKK